MFTETLEVTQNRWYLGEAVRSRLERCNATAETLRFEYGGCGGIAFHHVVIRDSSDAKIATYSPAACIGVREPDSWQPGECRTSSLEWPQLTGEFPCSAGEVVPIPTQVEPGGYYAELPFGEPPLRTDNVQFLAQSVAIPTSRSKGLVLLAGLVMVAA